MHVWRDETNDEVLGFLITVALHETSEQDWIKDPAVRAAWTTIQNRAPLRSGEGALYFRFWMAAETYQAVSPIQSLIFVDVVRSPHDPGAGVHSIPLRRSPNFWAPVLTYADLHRLPEAEFESDGGDLRHRFGVYGHDWRIVPPLAWLALLAERGIASQPLAAAPPASVALVVLSRPEFESAVQNALRHFTRPDQLADNPLLNSRLVAEEGGLQQGESDRVEHLRRRINSAAELLQQSARDAKLYRALDRLFSRPTPTQEAAAEILDLPFSTYRRHLRAGVAHIVNVLWQWELGNAEP